MNQEIERLERELESAKERLLAARRAAAPGRLADRTLRWAGSAAPVRLSDLFGAKPDMLVIHNMGRQCSYCTLWADGFAGIYKHVADRCAFVLTTPDDPAIAGAFAAERAWPFPVVSIAGTAFAKDMGFAKPDGGVIPGVSPLRREPDGTITRPALGATFGPGDDFCALWPMLDLLKEGAADWSPRFHYA